MLAYNAHLTPEQKALVEFMRDGPRSTGQSGHWLYLAHDVSRRDGNDLDRDVKMFFAVGNTAFDAFIASWDAKRYYDSSRPWTLVRYYYAGKKVSGWGGPGKGVVTLPAEEWHPYSPFTFVTPPFPGYTSGHSTVSGACAKMLELFTGSDRFGDTEQRTAGTLTEPGFKCDIIQMVQGKAPTNDKLTCDVALADADLHGSGRHGRFVARPGRLSHPVRQRRGFETGPRSRRVPVAENPDLLRRDGGRPLTPTGARKAAAFTGRVRTAALLSLGSPAIP